MTKLSELKNTHRKDPSSKRVGRGVGTGKGKTCGRGNKGAKSRSGYKRRTGYEGGQLPMFRKVPIRGFTNGRFKEDVVSFNLSLLDFYFEAGEEVNVLSLAAKKLISKSRKPIIKILGNGELTKPLTFRVHRISEGAEAKVIQAQGKVVLVNS